MKKELIGRKTRLAFRELLVGYTLRTITDLFESNEIEYVPLPDHMVPSGQRRGLVERFYAAVNWHDPDETRRVLNVYEDALLHLNESDEKIQGELIKCLERDGYQFIHDRIVSAPLKVSPESFSIGKIDTRHLHQYLERINAAADSDPALAIGSTKELIEATLKTVLEQMAVSYDDKREDVPALLRKVQKALDLVPSEVDESKRGAETIKKILSNLGAVAVGVAELRNLYGTGHGKASATRGLSSRHARLVATSGAALCQFLLETLELRAEAPSGERT